MSTSLDEQRLEAWKLFLRAHASLMVRLEQELEAEVELPLTWYDVLAQLNRAPGQRLRMHDLLHDLVLSKSGLSRRIDRMEEAGLVERAACPQDARVVHVALTLQGQDALQDAMPIHLRGIGEHFARFLTPDEVAAFESAFRKMLRSL
jgi:DNA-binding MarR family transcriptional regulator